MAAVDSATDPVSGEFDGRVAVITGTSWIAAEVARLMVERGGSVVVVGPDIDVADEVVGPLGDSARFVTGSTRSDEDLGAALHTAVQCFGGVDVIVAAHASFVDDRLETDRERWLEALDVNVAGTSLLVQKAVPLMEQRGGGAVVLVTSISGKASQPDRLVYPVTKAALLGMVRNLAQVLAPKQIRVNSVSPGWTWSRNIERRYGTRERADRYAAEFQLLGRLGDPAEVAEAVLFLCSDRSSFTTGADLAVDGGYASTSPEALGHAQIAVPEVG